ncbi:MAG TPA: hypothetical protein VE088_09565 [Gaiellaceae bacterium]|nr:hypothetical protein [Gaiellaceae bacterium]
MRILRTISTGRLLLLLAGVALALAAVGAVAVRAATGSGSPPPAQPLANALHDAATASKPAGISARISFTNDLVPSLSSFTGQGAVSPLLSGANGRLWLTGDGYGRIELQSNSGNDSEITWSPSRARIYDGTSNTVYEVALPQHATTTHTRPHTPPTVAQIQSFLSKLTDAVTLSNPVSTVIGGQGAYSVRVTPKDSSSLLDGARIGWDAVHGVPLEIGIYARGVSGPVVSLTATGISYAPVPASDVKISPPPGAKIVTIPTPSSSRSGRTHESVGGLAAVQAKLPFTLAAPATLDGKARASVRLLGGDSALLVYGKGLSAIAVVERQPAQGGAQQPPSALGSLPTTTIAGAKAQELPTQLGTLLRFEHAGVSFLVGAALPQHEVEQAAAGLAS